MTDASEQALTEWEIRQELARTKTGEVVEVDLATGIAVVEVGGIDREVPWVGDPPFVGAAVRVSTIGQVTFCQVVNGAGFGTATSVDVANRVAMITGEDGGTYRCRYSPDQTLAAGEKVVIDLTRQVVLLRLTAAPPPPPPPPAPSDTPAAAPPKPKPPPAQPVIRSRDFLPIWSGTWWNGSYTSANVIVGSTQLGAYGYGTSIGDTIPNSATIRAARMLLRQSSDRLPHIPSLIGTHTAGGRPRSLTNASINGSWPIPGGTREIDIRGTIVNRLINGTALGIGFRSGQSWRTYGQSPSGRIHIEWEQ